MMKRLKLLRIKDVRFLEHVIFLKFQTIYMLNKVDIGMDKLKIFVSNAYVCK